MASIDNCCPNCFANSFTGLNCSRCGYTVSQGKKEHFVLPPGALLNQRYILGRVLGVGGFGITYLALDIEQNQKYAIKEYFPNEIALRDGSSVAPSGNKVVRVFEHGLSVFFDEAQILRQFAEDPNIVHVYNCFRENNTAYFVMEYLDGVNLKRLTSISYSNAEEVFFIVADSLQKVHEKGLLHRDISPENIFITKQGMVKLIDFGATRYYIGGASRSLSVILKPGFAPPEQYSSKGNQGPWTDIYALAATFYSLLSGKVIPDALERLNGQAVARLSQIVPEVSDSFAAAIEHALNLNYKERFQTIDDFISAIDKHEKPPVPETKAAGKPYIQFISGPLQGRKWLIPSDLDIIIGRATSGNIVIPDNSISREHCILRYSQDKQCFYIRDVSSNGTYCLSGKRLDKDTIYTFRLNDMFYMATSKYTLKVGID